MGVLAGRAQVVHRHCGAELPGESLAPVTHSASFVYSQYFAQSLSLSRAAWQNGNSEIYYDDGELQTLCLRDERIEADQKSGGKSAFFVQSFEAARERRAERRRMLIPIQAMK